MASRREYREAIDKRIAARVRKFAAKVGADYETKKKRIAAQKRAYRKAKREQIRAFNRKWTKSRSDALHPAYIAQLCGWLASDRHDPTIANFISVKTEQLRLVRELRRD